MENKKRAFSQSIPINKSGENIFNSLGKMPPQALELEQAVLGALMLEKDALTEVIEILQPESFYKDSHNRIYNAIRTLFSESEPVDMLTVTNQLKKSGELELIGGPFYITELTQKVNSAANIEYHARVILEMAIKRELISIGSEVQKSAFDETTDALELLDHAGAQIFEVSDRNVRKDYSNVKDLMVRAIDEIHQKKEKGDGLTGVPSGFTELDRITSGWQKSDLIIIAARPGMGKTAFALSCLRNAAIDHNIPTAIFSLEMSSIQLVNRLIAAEAELPNDKIRNGKIQEYEEEQLYEKTKKLAAAKIFIDDTPGLSILELRAKSRKLKQQHDVGLIIVDYMQLMTADLSKKGGNREQEIASISRSLKTIAKELEIPVLALSQLSRAVETRGGDKRPQLSDLRESGSIEQDADIVSFIYRPEYYNINADEEGDLEGLAELIISKHRNGSTADVKLRFIGQYTKFVEWSDFGFNSGFNKENYGKYSGGSVTIPSKANKKNQEKDDPDASEAPF
jgi:replicative DNA helicase